MYQNAFVSDLVSYLTRNLDIKIPKKTKSYI
jgi:hypothetical protein